VPERDGCEGGGRIDNERRRGRVFAGWHTLRQPVERCISSPVVRTQTYLPESLHDALGGAARRTRRLDGRADP
jgi:hypothetical protein